MSYFIERSEVNRFILFDVTRNRIQRAATFFFANRPTHVQKECNNYLNNILTASETYLIKVDERCAFASIQQDVLNFAELFELGL